MIALALLASLAVGQVPDAGASDAPFATLDKPLAWMVPGGSPDGGTAVCMDSDTAIDNARELVGYRAQAHADDAALKQNDPATLRIILVAVGAVLVGGALTFGVLDATGHVK